MHLSTILIVAALAQTGPKNVGPQIGYVYPPGGRAGSTIEVRLGTYDWTPDMQLFVHDPRVKIELTGPAGEPILTPPPYWFGTKAGQVQPPLPREIPARITIAAEVPPGPIHWQVANANGGSDVGTFIVGDGVEFVEPEQPDGPVELPSLPTTVSGRISRIAEVDQYRFTTTTAGLVTCRLDDQLGRPFDGVLSIRDKQGRVVADAADTIGRGAQLVFTAAAGAEYVAVVNDADHAGDRGYVYRLSIEPGPYIVAALPSMVPRGATTDVEFIGWGAATGALRLESIVRKVKVPKTAGKLCRYESPAPVGRWSAELAVADVADAPEPTTLNVEARPLAIPARIAGALDRLDATAQMPIDRYRLTAKKGDALLVSVESARFGSPVDPSLAVVAADGKEIARNDDFGTSTDARLEFVVPADGLYDVIVTDYSGTPPSRAHVYRLIVENSADAADFEIQTPDRFDLALGTKADLVAKVIRRGTWQEPVTLRIEGLPEGVAAVAEEPAAPPVTTTGKKPVAKKPAVKKLAAGDQRISLTAKENAPAGASPAVIVATATLGERTMERRSSPILVTTTLKPRCVVKSAVQDGGRIVNRGTTYPAEVIVERLEGFTGPVTLQMASTQQRQRRGIRGETLEVPPGTERVLYPVFMPEWLETSLTARINVLGVTKVADPRGNLRYVTGAMDGLIVMSIEGGLWKISHDPAEHAVEVGGTIDIPVKISRTVRMVEAAKVEVVPLDGFPELYSAEPVPVAPQESSAVVKLRLAATPQAVGRWNVRIRATALQNGRWPAVTEVEVPITIEPARTP